MAKKDKSSKRKGKSKVYKIDFGGVPEDIRKRGRRIPEGDYLAKISHVERKKNKAGDAYYFNWTFQVIESASGDKKYKGVPVYFTTSLKPDALFNLRNLINAATGKNVAGKSLNFNPKKLINEKIGITVEDDEYEDKEGKTKKKSAVADVMPVSELVEDEEDDDEEDDEDDDEEEEEGEDDEDDEDDEDEEDDEEDEEDDDEDDDDDDDDDLDDVDVDDDL